MKLTQSLGLLALACLLAACSTPDKPAFTPAPLTNFKSTAQFDVRWKYKIGAMGINVLFPAVSEHAIVAANSQGEIVRLDLQSGNVLWQIKNSFAISAGVGAGEGLLIVGSAKGEVAAYAENDGQLRWTSKVTSEVLGAPQVAEGVVVVRSGDGRIAGLNVQDGKRLWLYERATPALVARSNASVTLHNGIVYAGFAAGKLAAIGLHNGVTVWESSVSQPRGNTELERISDITSLPILDDSQVCAAAFQGRLACFDAEQGGALWTRDVASDKGLTISRKYLFFTDSDSTVLGLDKLSGSPYWKNERLSHRKLTAPLALGQYLLVADFEGYLHVLDRDDGHLVARLKTDGSVIRATPLAAAEGLVLQTDDGSLYFIKLHSL